MGCAKLARTLRLPASDVVQHRLASYEPPGDEPGGAESFLSSYQRLCIFASFPIPHLRTSGLLVVSILLHHLPSHQSESIWLAQVVCTMKRYNKTIAMVNLKALRPPPKLLNAFIVVVLHQHIAAAPYLRGPFAGPLRDFCGVGRREWRRGRPAQELMALFLCILRATRRMFKARKAVIPHESSG